jgi:putative membrane protein
MLPTSIPYCGAPPVPGGETWNLDPVLMGVLALLAGAHLWSARGEASWRQGAAGAGWVVAALALISPLCNLSVALFSARVGQHMILTLIAAPLIALALPRLASTASMQWAATALFAIALWFWHAPPPYEATFTSVSIYWAMHATLFGSALWFWATILRSAASPFSTLFASFVTGMQMSLLGALLTFARLTWFPVHAFTTQPWGLSPLEDQQLGGLIMWVPAGALLTGYAILLFGLELSRMGQPAKSPA